MTWVWRDGKLVEKSYTAPLARSSLPCPNIIRDGLAEPLRHMADGRMYDSKRAMARATREAGCVEVGNEIPKVSPKADPPPFSKDEVVKAYCKVRDGYKPVAPTEAVAAKDTGWI